MKALDKIYIQTNAGEAISSKWTTIPFRDFENTEYIRKEALMEWANKELKDNFEYHNDYDLALYSLIDKLNEM